jgi:hypothetical protein
MSDSFMDRLPSQEKEKIRKRLRSPEAYERLRDKVKGPEDLEKELDRSEKLAEVHLALESEPGMKESIRSSIEKDITEQGIENVLEMTNASPEAKAAIEQGKFDVAVDAHPDTHEDALVVLSEGNIQEKIAIKPTFSDRYVGSLQGHN